MEFLLRRIIRFLIDSFCRIIDEEIKRVDAYNRQYLDPKEVQ